MIFHIIHEKLYLSYPEELPGRKPFIVLVATLAKDKQAIIQALLGHVLEKLRVATGVPLERNRELQ